MNKAEITATIVARTGLSAKRGKDALEAMLKLMKKALKEDRSIDLGQLGRLRTVRLSRRRRITRGLKNVGTSISVYSKHAKTVKLKSKLDLSKEPLRTIVHPPPANPKAIVFLRMPCAIAYPRWRKRNSRGYSQSPRRSSPSFKSEFTVL
jgi:nucleoid DNA-binding protein